MLKLSLALHSKPTSAVSKNLGFLKPSLTETNGEKACIYDIDKDDKDDYQDHNYAATFMHV